MKPKVAVLGAMTGVTVITTVAGIRRGTLDPQWLLGIAGTTVLLMALTGPMPEVAVGMAVLLFLSVLIAGSEGIEGLTQAVTEGRTRQPARGANVPGTGGGTRQPIPTD